MEANEKPSQSETDQRSLLARLLAGEYGLAVTYWILYFVGCGLFFLFASRAVDRGQWLQFLSIVALMMLYTFALLGGIRAAYKGPKTWKVMSRTSSIFFIINILLGISTLGFIY